MSEDSEKGGDKQLNLYHSPEQSKVEYELVKLPLQDYVSVVRKAVSQAWSQMEGAVKTSVSSIRHKTEDQLVALGVKSPVMVLQAGAVGTAALIGLLMARRKSLARRILYPLVGGSAVWGVIVVTDSNKREKVFGTIRNEFSENFVKHFPKEYTKHLPAELKKEVEKYDSSQDNSNAKR